VCYYVSRVIINVRVIISAIWVRVIIGDIKVIVSVSGYF
jgi:hypothetical protein